MMYFTSNSYKHLQNRRTAFYAILLSIFAFFVHSPLVFAASVTVENIMVDVTADNAVEAREKAFEAAQIKGYKMLAEKFLSSEEFENFKTPDIDTVSAYVKDFEVTKEKLSATRYAGTYKIRYNNKAFAKSKAKQEDMNQKVLRQRGDILVLPFFADGGHTSIWRTNPFMQAWINARDANIAAPAIVPKGDTQDISAVRDNQGLKYDVTSLENLKKRYRAGQAAILVATPELLPDGTQNISVEIYQAKSYGPDLSDRITVRSALHEPREQLYSRVVNEVNKTFSAPKWKSQRTVAQNTRPQDQALTGPVQVLVAQVDFSTMRQWVETKKSLERTRGVRNVNVKSLSPRSATLALNYQGSIDNLRAGLQRNGVGLNDPLTQYGQVTVGNSAIYQLSPRP